MKDKLSENLRTFRKERGLTQDQLAEVLNVSMGVISKWELGLSSPEVGIILELADFFEVSVDVLLGYQMQSKSKALFIEQLKHCIYDKSADIPFYEVEKALKKYPHDFTIIYCSAELYEIKGVNSRDPKYNLRALALYEQACELFSQNSDPTISITSIRLRIAQIYRSLEQKEKAAEILKENNPCGIHDALLGVILSDMGKSEDSVKYLSRALLHNIYTQFDIALGYINVYINNQKYHEAIDVVHWIEASTAAVKLPDKTSYIDKLLSRFVALSSFSYLNLGDIDSAKAELRRARNIAQRFDAAPTYDASRIRFVAVDAATGYDDYGDTAVDALEQAVKEHNHPDFAALWEEINYEETDSQKP